MPLAVALRLFMMVVAVLGVVGLVNQVIVPLVERRPLFPMFKKSQSLNTSIYSLRQVLHEDALEGELKRLEKEHDDNQSALKSDKS